MNYKIVNIASAGNPKKSILIVYTGGTFGMIKDEDGALVPFNFGKVVDRIPELRVLDLNLTVISFPEPIDSSNVTPDNWKDIAYIIEENYSNYHGFVILHGTDTMAYTASALSFMLEGLNKPVIFTGAQIPIGSIRSDARENLITALEIASHYPDGQPMVTEVCIFFNTVLLRANRSQKVNSSTFSAFHSENYPALAEAGISIDYNENALLLPGTGLKVRYELDTHVVILKIYPGISQEVVEAVLDTAGLRGVILETFGSGNTMQDRWFIEALEKSTKAGVIVVNVSQCMGGTVNQGKYETSSELKRIGVISGQDMTTEAALTKLNVLLGMYQDRAKIIKQLQKPLAGEMA